MQKKKIILVIVLACAAHVVSAAKPKRASAEYWWLCPVDRSVPIRPEFSSDELVVGSIEVRSDSARVVDHGTTYFSGDVELIKNSDAIKADEISYDRDLSSASAEGDVHAWTSSFLWRGERGLFNFEDKLSRLERGRYWLIDRQGRGKADLIRHDGYTDVTRLQQVDYTTCPRQAETWKFSASTIKLDHRRERGDAYNALLKVHGVPIFYIPYINFPLSDTRKSGFLVPTIGSSSESGADIKIPFYWNIAPDKDATIAPRIIGNRGEMLTGQVRYLGQTFRSSVDFEYLPSDDLDNGNERSSISFHHQQTYADHHGFLNALIQNVSDSKYFEDFGQSLSVTSQRYLDRRIETTYANRSIWLYGLLQSYQSIDDSIPDQYGPYRRVPQIIAQTVFPQQHLKPHFYALSEVTYFDRGNSVAGSRIDMEPTLSLPYIKPWLYLRPALGVKYTGYLLTDSQQFDAHENRAVPVLSVDSQLFAERRFELFGTRMLQTLEPRAYYLLVPKVGQDEYPVFDSGLFDLSFLNMFRDNRFSGHDRIGDANQMALAVTSRFFSLNSAQELFRASVGQIYYFRDREITLPGQSVVDTATSELIGEFVTNLGEAWSARATLQWQPDGNQTNKSAFSVRYAPRDGTIINAGYRQTKAITPQQLALGDIEQTEVSLRVPLTESLSIVGRWAYSLQSDEALEAVGGIEYESCCWGLRFMARRFLRNTAGQFDNAFLMQFEFKGLGGVGRSATSFLKKSIPGYEPSF